MLIWTVFILIASLLLLTAGAELLVRGSSSLALRLGLSTFFIGLTIVGFGTSTPELATSIIASLNGHTDVSIGNVVGSNIFNIAVVLGLTALITPTPVDSTVVRRESWIVIAVAFLPYAALLTADHALHVYHGAAMLVLLVAYIRRGYQIDKRAVATSVARSEATDLSGKPVTLPVSFLLVAIGLVMLVGGAHCLVESAVAIAHACGASDLVIGLTIVAGGTSAPELFTSVVAARRKQADLAVGNVLGSNIFNILGILGTASLFRPQPIEAQSIYLDVPVMILASVACVPIMLSHHHISRREGVVLLVGYGVYLGCLIFLAPRWFG